MDPVKVVEVRMKYEEGMEDQKGFKRVQLDCLMSLDPQFGSELAC